MSNRKTEPLERNDPRCKNMTAGIYCRKSTATEGKSKSLDEQLEICRSDAEKHGFGQVLEYIEKEGVKGDWHWDDEDFNYPGPHRLQLTRLVKAIKTAQVQAVIVYKLNRLTRDNGVEDAFTKLCQKYNVRLIVNGRDMELDTARGRWQSASEAARAREFRDQISEDIKRDHDWKFERLMFTRNPSCLGFRSAGYQQIEFRHEELALVRSIFEWFTGANGEVPLGEYQIAQKCMKEGIVVSCGAKNHGIRDRTKVTVGQIRSILENPMYIGEWQHNKRRKPYPQLLIPQQDLDVEPRPAIPRELWDAAAARLATKTKYGSRVATSKRLLAGLVVCSSCGLPCHVTRIKGPDGVVRERWYCGKRFGKQRSCFGESYSTCLVTDLDHWIKEYMCPMLALEIQEILGERKLSPVRVEFEKLKSELAELKRIEKERLAFAIKALDDFAFAELAKSLREERENKERALADYRRLFGGSDQENTVHTGIDLSSTEPEVLRAAIHRSIRWITVTKDGVIAYNKLGNYYAGGFEARDAAKLLQVGSSRGIRPPNSQDAINAIDWLTDRATFAAGRRLVLDDHDGLLSVDEIGA